MLKLDVGEAAACEVTTRRPCCATKIRKRCALSSSSGAGATSDPLRRLRLKRGVVVLRRTGGGNNAGGGSPCPSRRKMSESSWNMMMNPRARADGVMHSPSAKVSARKLVNALWQMNEGSLLLQEEEEEAGLRGSAAHRRCASSVEISKRSRTKNRVLDADGEWFSDKLSNGGSVGVHARGEDSSSMCSMGRDGNRTAHLQDMYRSLTASKELVRVLASIWAGPGDLNPSTAASLLAALRSELDLARAHARRLAKEDSRRGDEAELLKKRLAAEAHAWKSRQREKAAATVRVVAEELDGERRSRRRAERVNCKLGEALAEAERGLRAAEKELERERKSRERLEKVCEELVGSDPGEEVMRAAQAELDKEREMLRLADELREERVQMKLLEARLQFEEKNAVVDQLRGELQAFLDTTKKESPAAADEKNRLENASQGAAFDDEPIAPVAALGNKTDREDEDDSEGSDMHSIELNADGSRQECGWSYSTAASKEKAASSDRGITECAVDPWSAGAAAFDRQSLGEFEGGQLWDNNEDGGCSVRTSRDDVDEDSERYQAIKNLREQMLAGHGFIFLSQADEADAERQYDRYGLMCHDEDGKR